jgi:hypothetical protein
MLLFSGLLFTWFGLSTWAKGEKTWDNYIPYIFLGILLLFPGVYYGFILINIWYGTEGYEYSDVPDLSDN